LSCPSCGTEIDPGQPRCAACGALLAPPVEGALAPKPEPLRELPGLRKKEKTWRDEVNERVRSRRKRREAEIGLPLFDAIESAGDAPQAEEPPSPEASPPPAAAPRIDRTVLQGALEEPVADLPLRPDAEESPEAEEVARPQSRPAPGVASGEVEARPEEEWPLELQPPAPESRPVERPAQLAERLQAGALDLLLLSGVFAVVLYFTSRAARVDLSGLLPAWPWLAGYLAFLALIYAAYFTGTTGQTLGKMFFGLRVVDTAGQPPGYLRAFLRAAAGALGIAAAGLGIVPMAFDPARRALHDRAFRTRVIRG
jgi:uncharacterized RDD family membrane protein YckC